MRQTPGVEPLVSTTKMFLEDVIVGNRTRIECTTMHAANFMLGVAPCYAAIMQTPHQDSNGCLCFVIVQ